MCVYLPHFFDFVNPLVAVSLIGENESFIKNPIILHRNKRDFIKISPVFRKRKSDFLQILLKFLES